MKEKPDYLWRDSWRYYVIKMGSLGRDLKCFGKEESRERLLGVEVDVKACNKLSHSTFTDHRFQLQIAFSLS